VAHPEAQPFTRLDRPTPTALCARFRPDTRLAAAAEAVFILNALGDGAYGFQLRNDDNLPARNAMFSLLRDAFVNNLTVITDYLIDPGKQNGIAIRVALTR
jgi:hypothetical protein